MGRLTIPDELIEGGMRRAIIDARTVREEAMTIYWLLKKYEDICPEPESLKEIDALYLEKCREVAALKQEPWIPMAERAPGEDGDYLVTMVTPGYCKGQPYTNWLCWCGDDHEWTDTDGDTVTGQDTVIYWMPIPGPAVVR